MDNTERETHNLMKVDSFSQLPFLRPTTQNKVKGIRLFGKEFSNTPITVESESNDTITNNEGSSTNKDTNSTESSRRFECHYCCRNFPTSQALGGHQNAHKRERQHAKRAQLQSANMVHALSQAQIMYGNMNYSRFSSSPTWNNSNSSNGSGSGRFYGSFYSQNQLQQPINGSPLALWRIPSSTVGVQRNPSFNRQGLLHPLPFVVSGEEINARIGASKVIASSGSQNRYVYDSKPSVNDRVSLDLHL